MKKEKNVKFEMRGIEFLVKKKIYFLKVKQTQSQQEAGSSENEEKSFQCFIQQI